MSIHPDWYMRFRNFPEQDLDNLTEDHQNGDCPENCMLCEEEQYQRDLWEQNQQRREERKQRKCDFACAGKPGHSGPCFEIYSHRDTCPGAPDCIHDDVEEIGKRTVEKLDQAIDAAKALNELLEQADPFKAYRNLESFARLFRAK